jgi:hypothetical protein
MGTRLGLTLVGKASLERLHMRYVWAVLVVLGSAANAAEVGPCNDLDRISNLVGQPKWYSEGKIRIAHVDTDGEPVCCSSHLLVFIPSPEIGSQCFAVSQKAANGSESQRGFSSIEFNRIKASYDPQRGLLLNVPYTLYNPEGGRGKPGIAIVRVNLDDKGSVRIER